MHVTTCALSRRAEGAARVAVALATLLASGLALRAETRIGNTEIAKNEVVRLVKAATSPITVGDDVFADELVRTGTDSAAKFVFSDSTNLAVGAKSSVKLDRFVFNPDTSYAKAAVNLATGAFRFTTGGSEKRAYEIKTSTATIGVRGTVFDALVTKQKTTVTLVEGAVAICPRSRFDGDPRRLSHKQLVKYHCDELTRPGQTSVVTATRATQSGAVPFSFASSACGGDAGLCTASVATGGSSLAAISGTRLDENNPALCYWNPE